MQRKTFLKTAAKGLALYPLMPLNTRLAAASGSTAARRSVNSESDGIYRPEGYHLIWEDDFNGDQLDESEWFYRMDLKMSSIQRPENVKVENGNLVLSMRQHNVLGMHYTGGGIVTKRRWQHGYFEVKAKLANASGWHHSFWTTAGNGFLTYCFDRFMEIDVFEMEATDASNHNLWIHRDGWASKKNNWTSSFAQKLGFDASDGYHVYGYEYTSNGIRFFVDGKLVHSIGASEDQYKHYSMNLWLTVIATHSGSGGSDLQANDYYDYIRCYSQDPHAKPPSKVELSHETGDIIYVDNYDPWGFNMGDFWEISTEGNSYHGKNYYKWKPKNASWDTQRDWALFRPFISRDGDYDLYLRWPAAPDHAAKVPLEIWYEGGLKKDDSSSINQQLHDGEWVKVGNYRFTKGWDNMVKLLAKSPGYTVADAAKFIRTS